MPDIGFSEILLIFILGLIVLGPKKLPRVAAEVGRWIGRARAMARQFREQLEEEVTLEENRRKEDERKKAETAAPQAGSPSGPSASATTGSESAASGSASAPGAQPAPWVGAAVQPEIPPEFQSPPGGAEPAPGAPGSAEPNSAGPSTQSTAVTSQGTAVGSHDTHYAPPGEEVVSNESGHVDLTHEAWPYNGPAPPPEVDAVFHDALKQQAAVESTHSRDPSPESKPSETNTNEPAPGGADRATHERAT